MPFPVTGASGRLPPAAGRPFRLGTRRSPLAMHQAELVRAALCTAHGWMPDDVELVPIVATGDRVQDRALAEIGGKALWTRELDSALAEGRIDAAVHSMKDVESERPEAFCVAAMLPRADTRDRLLGAPSIAALRQGARVGTASPRRRAQLLARRPDLDVVLIRGNVQTRLAKLAAGEVDATLLAAAGLDRLGIADGVPLDELIPAGSQGAIGIELLAGGPAEAVVRAVDCCDTSDAVTAERTFLRAPGGSCHSPVAVQARFLPGQAEGHMQAELLSPDGTDAIRGTMPLLRGDARRPAALAADLLASAPEAVRAAFGTGG